MIINIIMIKIKIIKMDSKKMMHLEVAQEELREVK